jgi:hypothetical protein
MLLTRRKVALAQWIPLGAFATLAAIAGCGQSQDPASSGSADLTVRALRAADVANVTAIISGPALSAPRTVTLSHRDGGASFGALIGTLPVGSNYVFTADANGKDGSVLYTGTASGVSILKNQTTTVLITAQQAISSTPFKNSVPVIDSLLVSSTNVTPGATANATVTAHDADTGDSLSFAWSTSPSVGTFSDVSAATTTWTAPATEGDVTLTIAVQDTHGATTSASVVVHVSNTNGKGQAAVTVSLNTWPVISGLTSAPKGWLDGTPLTLAVAASDADNDPLSYVWTSSCVGSFSAGTVVSPTFTLAAGQSGACTLSVVVSDGRGGTTTGALTLPIGQPAVLAPPVIVDFVQSTGSAFSGQTVNLLVDATDPQGSVLSFQWSATGGTLSGQQEAATSSNVVWTAPDTCTGGWQVTVTITDTQSLVTTQVFTVNCALLVPSSLVISSSTYDRTVGAIASLTVGSKLAKSATATASATSGNNYVTVWNNASVDANFGVTSPIQLTDLDPTNGRVLSRVTVPSNQVVTSFPSKSELGLHISNDSTGSHLVFMGYAGAGAGAVDVSNSDAVAGQDPTNPVTFAFGASYAYARTIVSMDGTGNFAYTPTTVYGGNNGRSALLGSNGLYYAVGNANNGTAATFGPNGTNPDVTETTGLAVVTPINGLTSSVAIPPNNSAEVNPLLQYTFSGKQDKPGKDNNYRGITEFGGALYFTKGSGSNGMNTVYTVSTLPTVANAAATTISVVPGFPTDAARTAGGDYTPFAVFFANATTMYVSDEGTGDTLDKSSHAGLEKWSLVGGVWKLDYVLTQGLIGVVDSNLTGPDGPYPTVTTVGLRNLTGVVSGDQVTLWATTSTSSTSGDNGADPNKVVVITDQLSATTVTSTVAAESFQTLLGPTYGTVYRGVAFVN